MDELLQRYCSFHRIDEDGRAWTTSTRLVRVRAGVHARIPDDLRALGFEEPLFVVLDANTRRATGDDVLSSLQASGWAIVELDLAGEDDPPPGCDDETVAQVRDALVASGARSALAIGAGTINDLVKMAGHQAGVPTACVATAPSMNGYTSAIAAILSDGVKTTQPCEPPVAVFADPNVMANAPYRMIASGIGDLYSKPVSNADWRLSHRLLGSPHSAIVMEIVEAGSALLDGVAPRLPARDPDAVARLTGALMLSGLAMQAAGSSSTASGGEHLISHFIDMTSHAFGESHDLHGCQVAVGTLVTSRLYELVCALDPATIDVDALVAAHPAWPAWRETLRSRFGVLDSAVVAHAQKMYPDADTLRARLTTLVREWDSIVADVRTTLRPSADLEAELVSADCPTRFAQIGVDPARATRSIAWSKDIRARYTILHLAAELGLLDAFAERYPSDWA